MSSNSRLQEKVDLQNLNGRFACYIGRVKHLEAENSRLSRTLQLSKETKTRKTLTSRTTYDKKLSDTRKLIDDTARDKTKLEIDARRLWKENHELKTRLDKKSKDLMLAEAHARKYENKCLELNGKFNMAVLECSKVTNDRKELESEVNNQREQLKEIFENLDGEILDRVDAENNLQNLKEELAFKHEVYQQELKETSMRHKVELSEIDGNLAKQYKAKMQETMQELRDQYEKQISSHRAKIEDIYKQKIKNLEGVATHNIVAATAAGEELDEARFKVDGLCNHVIELKASYNAAIQRSKELEKKLEDARRRYSDDMLQLQAELRLLLEKMAGQLQEYQDLLDSKVCLDMQIATYSKLIEGEETRLNTVQATSSTGEHADLLNM